MSVQYNTIETICAAIKHHSELYEKRNGHLADELRSAKNFFATEDFKHWTFGKSVGANGEYHNHGGVAKKKLIRHGFKNVYNGSLAKDEVQKVEEAFFDWAHRTGNDFLIEKHRRQLGKERAMELYLMNND